MVQHTYINFNTMQAANLSTYKKYFYQYRQYLFRQNVFFCVSPNNTLANISSYVGY